MKKSLLILFLSALFFQASANVTMGSYRWRNNDGSETSASWKNAANQPISNVTKSEVLRVRVQLMGDPTQDATGYITLYYKRPDGELQQITTESNADFMLAGSVPNVTEDQPTTRQLVYSDDMSFVPGKIITSTNAVSLSLNLNTYTEYEWVIKPGNTIQKNMTYDFEMNIVGTSDENTGVLGTVTSHATLPLKLHSFDARLTDKSVQLQWSTAEEENVSHFDIEKSADGSRYTLIGRHPAASGTGNKFYSHTDKGALHTSNFYRLKIVDNNGSFTYSQISHVKTGESKSRLTIYPNPAKDNLTIRLTADAGPVRVALQDVTGRTINTFTTYSDGREINEVADIRSLKPGIYFISFNHQTVRFVKE